MLRESVINACAGDTAQADAVAVPVKAEGHYLTQSRRTVEHCYNALNVRAWGVVTGLMAIAVMIWIGYRHADTPLYNVMSRGVMCVIVAVLSLQIIATAVIGESWPLRGLSDTSTVAACIVALTGCFVRLGRREGVAAVAVVTALCGLSLYGWQHPAMRTVNVELESMWLPIHVLTMMCAYAMFVVATVMILADRSRMAIVRMLAIGETTLCAGILTGSVWAHEAWGAYWSWDPKETFALLTFMVYGVMALLIRRINRSTLRILSIAAIVVLLFTWTGVSVVGGRHVY